MSQRRDSIEGHGDVEAAAGPGGWLIRYAPPAWGLPYRFTNSQLAARLVHQAIAPLASRAVTDVIAAMQARSDRVVQSAPGPGRNPGARPGYAGRRCHGDSARYGALVALFQGACVTAFASAIGVPLTGGRLAALALPCLACCLLGGAFGLVTMASLPNQRSAMDVFQFLIIPQYLLGGVFVPLHGIPGYLDFIAGAMPLRYAVDLIRGLYFHGTPRYQQLVTTSPALDAAVMGVMIAAAMTAGTLIFSYRERAR